MGTVASQLRGEKGDGGEFEGVKPDEIPREEESGKWDQEDQEGGWEVSAGQAGSIGTR